MTSRPVTDRSAPAAPIDMAAGRGLCKVKGCANDGIFVDGWCEPHYLQVHRFGETRDVTTINPRPLMRLLPRLRS